jgi:transposase
MSGLRYTEEFKRDAVSQVTDRGYSVREVAKRLGINTRSLYDWKSLYHKPKPEREQDAMQASEVCRLKAELARVTEERDILKKATAYFAKDAR